MAAMWAPAECPMTNNRRGLPWNAAMLSCVHRSALAPSMRKSGNFDLGIEPVVRNDDNVTARRQRGAKKSIPPLTPDLPASTVEEHDDRRACGTARLIDIELVAGAVGIGNVAHRIVPYRCKFEDTVDRLRRSLTGGERHH